MPNQQVPARSYHVRMALDWRLFGDELVVFNPMDSCLHIMPANLLPLLSCFSPDTSVTIGVLTNTYQSLNLSLDSGGSDLEQVLNQWLALNLISCRQLH